MTSTLADEAKFTPHGECSTRHPVAVVSHERSGTHLTIDLLRNFYVETQVMQRPLESVKSLYWDLEEWLPETGAGASQSLEGLPHRPIVKTHVLPDLSNIRAPDLRADYEHILTRSTKIYVVRDGRDVAVSYFYFRQKFEQGTNDFLEFLSTPFRPGGLTMGQFWAHHVAFWRSQPGISMIRYEDFCQPTEERLAELGRAAGLTRNRQPARPIRMTRSRWLRFLQRLLGVQQSSAVLPRKGEPGDWKNHFNPEAKRIFQRDAGEVLAVLGYEQGADW